MQIHIYHQSIYSIARMLIEPLINRTGITPIGMAAYNTLWFIASNSARTIGLPGTVFILWQFRRFLFGRISATRMTNMLTSYLPTVMDSFIIRTVFRLSRNHNNNPFVTVVNYIITATLANMFNFMFKRFLFYFGFAIFSSLFSIIVATLGIFWILQLRDITTFLNFGFKLKEIIESYLPFNWKLPIPDIFQNKKMYILSLGILGLPILTFFYPIWFSNLLEYFDVTPYLGIFTRPIKGLLTYCI